MEKWVEISINKIEGSIRCQQGDERRALQHGVFYSRKPWGPPGVSWPPPSRNRIEKREKRERAGRPPKFERVADGSQQRVSQRASLATSESVQYQVSLSGLKRETMRSAILALAFAALIATAGVVTRGTFRAE